MYKLGIIGGGNMGEAIIAGSRGRFSILVSEKDNSRQKILLKKYKLTSKSIGELTDICDCIIVAVKPQDFDDVLIELCRGMARRAPTKGKTPLVISIAAGITTKYIERILGKNIRVIRTMPNLPALIGQGITAIAKGHNAKQSDVVLAKKIFNNIGATVAVKESSIDAITAVSGSGPAYVYLFMECLIKSAQSLGLEKNLSAQLVKKTFEGSLNLLLKQNADPEALRVKVTSKGGTTHAALEVFAKNKFDKIVTKALQAAAKRAKQLSK